MPKVKLNSPAVLRDPEAKAFAHFPAGAVVERPAAWCDRWIKTGRATAAADDAPAATAKPKRRKPAPETRA